MNNVCTLLEKYGCNTNLFKKFVSSEIIYNPPMFYFSVRSFLHVYFNSSFYNQSMVKASFENDESYERLKLILQDQFNPEEVNEKHFLHLFKNIDLRLEEFAFKDESDYEEIFERFTIMQEEFQPDKERDIEAFNKVFYKRRIQPLG